MAVPIVSGSEVNTPTGGVKINAGAFREAALAPGRVAKSIGDNVGGVLADVGFKIQENRNARTILDADLKMRKTKDDFTASLATNPDETTWLPAYKEQVSKLKEQVLSGPNVGPDVRRVLTAKLDTWEQATTSELNTAALLKGVKETRDTAISDATYAAQQGDLEGAHNAIKVAVETGSMSESEAGKITKNFPSIAATAEANVIIATDPIRSPELIEQYKSIIKPVQFRQLQRTASEAKNRRQSENTNLLAIDMDNSPDGTIDPELLKEKVKAGEIDQRAANGLVARMEKTRATVAKDDFTLLMSQVYDHNFTDDKTPDATARAMKDEGAHLPTALRTRLYKSIDSRMNAAKKQGEQEDRPVAKQIFDQMREDRARGYMVPSAMVNVKGRSGFFGIGAKPDTTKRVEIGSLSVLDDEKKLTDEMITETFGKGVTRKDLIRQEQLRYATVQGKMREWFNDPENKNATYEQANKYRMDLEKPYVMSGVQNAINGNKPKIRVKQGGKTYEWDGVNPSSAVEVR